MKKILYNICTVSAGLVLMLGSCTKKVDEAFMNPNADVRVPIESLLPGIISNFVANSAAAGSAYGLANDGMYIGRYVQYWATNITANQYDRMGGATGASDILGSVWAMHYFGMGENLNKMIQWGIEEKKWDYVGVGYAIRAWSWLTLTTVYGEVIVRESFRPDQLVFKYDDQEVAYEEARKTAHIALSYLSMTGDGVNQANLAKGDAFFYNGDVNKWKKFVYSTLARSFNHLTNKSSYNPDSVLHYANLGINSNDDNASVKFLATGLAGTYNFYGPFRGNVGSMRQGRFITDLMTGVNPMTFTITDPRTPYLLRENNLGTYRGVRPNKGTDGLAADLQPQNFWGGSFGTTAAPGNDDNARFIFRNGAPWPVITASENHFMKAEAYFRKNQKGQARESYIDGIRTNFDLLMNTPDYHNSVPAAKRMAAINRDTFLTNTTIVPSAANLTLSHIMLQKYIALFAHGTIESWVDVRRYHYTDLDPMTGQQVYATFTPPPTNELWTDNLGEWVYRARPRYNSEYLYNVAELQRIGAIALSYHTKKQWFSEP
jgi:hypothetical protein